MIRLHDREPDGVTLAPHHHYQGLTVVIGAAVFAGGGVVTTLALLSILLFATGWRDEPWAYPRVSALLSILLAGACAPVVWVAPWWGLHASVAATLGVLVALDDSLEHAFGIATPIDRVWNRLIYPRLRGGGS